MQVGSERMGKPKAFLIHLAISLGAIASAVGVLIWRWYPMPYFAADGGWQGLRLVVAVDAVLGPLLTLVVYNKLKSRRALLFDYSVIAILQASALVYGIWTVYHQRTVLVVFAENAFYTVDAASAVLAGPEAESLLSQAETTPAYAIIEMPHDAEERQRLRRECLATGRPLYLHGELYKRLDPSTLPSLEGYQADLKGKAAVSARFALELRKFFDDHAEGQDRFFFLPATCRYAQLILAIDRSDSSLAGWLHDVPRPVKATRWTVPSSEVPASTVF